MKFNMKLHSGLGLAAPQIGNLSSVFIVKDSKHTIHAFVNPKILETDGAILLQEGCLSAPGIFLPISRPEGVFIEYQDLNGTTQKLAAEGVDARAILHEMDHLQGKFYFDLVNRQARKAAISKLKKNLR